jgi:membrane associated rhomboid family serine protease
MFPLYDENPTELRPVVTILVMGLCLAAWLLVQGGGSDPSILMASVCTYGLIPAELTGSAAGALAGGAADLPCRLGGPTWATTVTSMFLHGGWGHLLGNLWFLWVFGNNIEDSMGHARFVLFYILCGLGAAAAQVLQDPGSAIPMVGASGAISGVMGAYALLYPRARVNTAIILVIFIRIIPLPAWMMLGYWFLLQLLAGSMGMDVGTAFWAHIGGFISGVALIKLFERPQLVVAKRAHRRLGPEEIKELGWW